MIYHQVHSSLSHVCQDFEILVYQFRVFYQLMKLLMLSKFGGFYTKLAKKSENHYWTFTFHFFEIFLSRKMFPDRDFVVAELKKKLNLRLV